jgi:hypothetical protein
LIDPAFESLNKRRETAAKRELPALFGSFGSAISTSFSLNGWTYIDPIKLGAVLDRLHHRLSVAEAYGTLE